jgi:hypothetical protein
MLLNIAELLGLLCFAGTTAILRERANGGVNRRRATEQLSRITLDAKVAPAAPVQQFVGPRRQLGTSSHMPLAGLAK